MSSYQADENENTGKMTLGLSVIMRVTLKDGTFHEVRASEYAYAPRCLTLVDFRRTLATATSKIAGARLQHLKRPRKKAQRMP